MIWINGKTGQTADLQLDDGLLFGRGAFETIRVGGQPYFWSEHLARLNHALAALKIRPALDPEALLNQVRALPIRECVLKIVVTAENLILQTRPLPETAGHAWRLTLAPGWRPANQVLLRTKNLSSLDYLLTRENVQKVGFDDALLTNSAGLVTETTRANIFWLRAGKIFTPDLSCGLLGGIVRQWLMADFTVETGFYPLADLFAADAVFATNSVVGIQPVGWIAGTELNSDPIVEKIARAYDQTLRAFDGR